MRASRRAGAWLRPFFIFLLLSLPAPAQTGVVDEVSRLVRREFFDPNLQGVNWDEVTRQAEGEVRSAHGWLAVSGVVNRMLGTLKTSHTRFYSPDEPGYYELLGIFSPLARGDLGRWMKRTFPEGKPTYEGIGVATDAENFVLGVWDGFPAAEAGLKVGDRLLEVDGRPYAPVTPFKGKKQVTLKVESQPGQTRSLKVRVMPLDCTTVYQTAMEKSARREGRWAYVHVWSYLGEDIQEKLTDLLAGPLKGADGLVLDLRDGWGGAMPSYLNLYNQKVPVMEFIDRNGRVESMDTQWRKPVVMLVNERSRSGKEVLAFGFKRYGIGKVVGSPTAGAVVGGRPMVVSGGGILYLAVVDVKVDGERIEGHPVVPDVVVDRPIPYCQGADPQLVKAFQVLEDVARVADR